MSTPRERRWPSRTDTGDMICCAVVVAVIGAGTLEFLGIVSFVWHHLGTLFWPLRG